MNREEHQQLIESAAQLAARWQARGNELLTREEEKNQAEMKRLLTHPTDKVSMTKMIDQSFRSHDCRRVADQILFLFDRYGVPGFFSARDQLLLKIFLKFGRFAPSISVPRFISYMRKRSSRSVIPGEPAVLSAHLAKRKSEGVRMNLNHLGEAVLGEVEAQRRLESYISDLQNPEIEYISVKISTIFSQISSLSFEETVQVLVHRLSTLFSVARDNEFLREDGTSVQKFVNLDMEEYRDLRVTAEAFLRALDQPELFQTSAGIVLQAYLPDAYPMQVRLTDWARDRVSLGGAPIKIRLVKGANMEMELVESSLHGWPLAPYDNKLDVDANFKKMVRYAMRPENVEAVQVGIASHNLFELAYALEVAEFNDVKESVTVEMLEGMADHVRRAIQETHPDMLLYAPVAARDEFINAIAYLIRRLDENTGEENFLRYSPSLEPGSEEWSFLEKQFRDACSKIEDVATGPNRTQDRNTEKFSEDIGTFATGRFVNEPDTDWSLPENVAWAEEIRRKWKKSSDDPAIEIPLVIGGEEIFEDRPLRQCFDPAFARNNEPSNVRVATFRLGTKEDADRAVEVAVSDPDGWRSSSAEERHEALTRVAHKVRERRGDLMGAAAAETGKVFTESDPEVSEAVDFLEFYPWSVRRLEEIRGLNFRGKGVGLVISPWNFPIAIPCGGIAASLAAGNTVIFKPSSEAVLTAWVLCSCFWDAGVSRNVLQFLPCSGAETGPRLVKNSGIDYIILTGGTETGMRILADRPDVPLAAETGGKNATIVTGLSDRDHAIGDLRHSAFSNSGQKCSATSLLILTPELFDDQKFRTSLVDACASWDTGPAWSFQNRVGPLIKPPSGDLLNALTRLEPGEEWALQPECKDENPYVWTPGIKWNVQPGSYTHMTEFFGPLLGVMKAESLEHAIELVNQTGFGLTSALESLDSREQMVWQEGIRAGNLYLNRGTTGAIVLRQPFGGMGKSALGAGIKAGGLNYVTQFMEIEEDAPPEMHPVSSEGPLLSLIHDWENRLRWEKFGSCSQDLEKTVRAIHDFLHEYDAEFSREHDFFKLRGQDNIFRYLPVGHLVIRLHAEDSLFDVLARCAAAVVLELDYSISMEPGLDTPAVHFLHSREGRLFEARICEETDDALIKRLPDVDRLRYAAPDRVPMAVFEAAAKLGLFIAREPVMMHGRIELLRYLREQAVCVNYHRYGNLQERGLVLEGKIKPAQ